ncbi:MAG: lyase family protein, partial [Chloroflexi bacterium]|nr:lyase family protein [Chloroflexota bacterium]
MTPRYTRPEMGHIWSRQHYFQCQLEVEIAVCEAWAEVGLIPRADIEKIRGASFSIDRIDEIESTTDHETDAFVAATAETLGPESRWLHYGLTSSDVLDTGLSLQLVAAADQLLERLRNLESVASKRALEHKKTLTIARTHGIHAEPTTFGFKLLVWVDEIRRQIRRLEDAKEQIAYGKISG